ncbi:hypothetical protein ACWD5F_13215 [Streptomyces sp. NPDC002499]
MAARAGAPARRTAEAAVPAASRVRRVGGDFGCFEDFEDFEDFGDFGGFGDWYEPWIVLSFGRWLSTISPLFDAVTHSLVARP